MQWEFGVVFKLLFEMPLPHHSAWVEVLLPDNVYFGSNSE